MLMGDTRTRLDKSASLLQQAIVTVTLVQFRLTCSLTERESLIIRRPVRRTLLHSLWLFSLSQNQSIDPLTGIRYLRLEKIICFSP